MSSATVIVISNHSGKNLDNCMRSKHCKHCKRSKRSKKASIHAVLLLSLLTSI